MNPTPEATRQLLTSDNFALWIALAATVVACAAYLIEGVFCRKRAESKLERFARGAYWVSLAGLGYTALYLFQCILSNQRFDIAYVFNNSAPRDELIYRVSAFWAGQQGSMLFWALLGGIIGAALVIKHGKSAPLAVAFWTAIQVFLLTVLVADDPFAKLPGFQPQMVGAGLNPLLKNPWMAVHPPVIFLGYALLSVPAVLALQAIVLRDTREWAVRCLPWTIAGWLTLGAGIMMGMIWSYEVLGWGGYWKWDPVENASLIPWLVGTALLHGLLVQRSRGTLSHVNVIVAFASFLTVLFATYLTRSGALGDASVHSFEPNKTAIYVKWGTVFFTVLCTGLAAAYLPGLRAGTGPSTLKSRDIALIFGILILVIFGIMVFAGTSYSILAGGASGKIAEKLLPDFFTNMSKPLAVALLVLIALVTVAPWRSRKWGGHVAHAGVFLLILGVVFSTLGKSKDVFLNGRGASGSAFGHEFTYRGLRSIDFERQSLDLDIRHSGRSFRSGILSRQSERGSATTPLILSSLTRDLYISPKNVDAVSISPKLELHNDSWHPIPAKLPGTNVSIILDGMQVESREARMYYQVPGREPVQFTVSPTKPAKIGGQTLRFGELFSEGGSSAHIVGVSLLLDEKLTINVSTKPYIWLLWLGCALMIVGGAEALFRRSLSLSKAAEGTGLPLPPEGARVAEGTELPLPPEGGSLS